jgi:DNA-binding beta-propeller fold protein YncE
MVVVLVIFACVGCSSASVSLRSSGHLSGAANLQVEGHAVGVAVSPGGSQVYVLSTNNVVDVMDANSGRLITALPVDANPQGLALTSNGRLLYVASRPDDEWGPGIPMDPAVTVIDTAADKRVADLALPGASSVAASPNGRFVFVADGNGVSVISTATNAVTNTLPLPDRSQFDAIAVSPDGSTIYGETPSSYGSEGTEEGRIVALNVLDGSQEGVLVTPGLAVSDIGADPNGRYVYVTIIGGTSSGTGTPPTPKFTVEALAAKSLKVVSKIAVGRGVGGVAFSPDGKHAYLTDTASYDVAIVDTGSNRVVGSISYSPNFGRAFGHPEPAGGIAISPHGDYAYLTAERIIGLGSGTVEPLRLR